MEIEKIKENIKDLSQYNIEDDKIAEKYKEFEEEEYYKLENERDIFKVKYNTIKDKYDKLKETYSELIVN